MTRWRRQHVITLQYLAGGVCLGVVVYFLLAGSHSVAIKRVQTRNRGGHIRKARQGFVLEKGLDRDNSALSDQLVENIIVLCYAVIPASDVPAKRKVYEQTWGKKCSRLLLFSNKAADEDTIIVSAFSSRHIEEDAKASLEALVYLYQHHIDHAHWFLRVHPMTHVVLENLRYFLKDEDPSKPIYFGQKLHDTDTFFPFGFGGYVFSREALKVFGAKGHEESNCSLRLLPESLHIAECFNSLGIEFGDSRDEEGRSRFHGISVESIAVQDYPNWFHELDPYDNMTRQGIRSVSNYAITFCPISDDVIISMEYFVNTVRVYGRLQRPIEINRKPEKLANKLLQK